jgi:hypothetical protein
MMHIVELVHSHTAADFLRTLGGFIAITILIFSPLSDSF